MSDLDSVTAFDRLPENFVEALRNPRYQLVEPRPAATIVLLRESDSGVESRLQNRLAIEVGRSTIRDGHRVYRNELLRVLKRLPRHEAGRETTEATSGSSIPESAA